MMRRKPGGLGKKKGRAALPPPKGRHMKIPLDGRKTKGEVGRGTREEKGEDLSYHPTTGLEKEIDGMVGMTILLDKEGGIVYLPLERNPKPYLRP